MVTKPYCGDCPDREACHQGAYCDYVHRVALVFTTNRPITKPREITMTNNSKITPADVAAKAVEENLVTTVPSQNDGEKKVATEETPELTVVEGEKKTFKERVAELREKLKENKKAVIAVGAAAGIAGIAFVKYAKKRAEEQLEMVVSEEDADDETAA